MLDPIEFIARLAAPEVPLAQRARSVPRPRAHLTRYHGVFAPNFKHRRRIVPKPAHRTAREPHASRPAPMSWMQRLKRRLPHRHRTLWRVWRHIARHRVHRDPRRHRENPHPSRRPQHRLHRLPPRTAAPCATKRNPRPPHHRRCPDCARGCTTAPLRLASCAPRPPTAFLTYVHDCRLQIASPRPRYVCSRTDIEPDNDHTGTPTTMSIDGLFFLSVVSQPSGQDVDQVRKQRERCKGAGADLTCPRACRAG